MDKLPVGQLPDLQQSNNDDEIMVITNSEYNQLKKEKISDLITDFTSTDENNALTKGTDGKMFVTDFGNASNITEGTLPTSVLPDIPKDLLPAIETSDLPVSGVTADTYAYPSSVTVNAQGQVTAIEEGTPSGANANTDLSNLTDEGEKHFLNKTQITNCILEAPNGVVEWSGVTPTGSLVNNQGVVSGFSESNYGLIDKTPPSNITSYEFMATFTTGAQQDEYQGIFANSYTNRATAQMTIINNNLYMQHPKDASTWKDVKTTTPLLANTTYQAKGIWDGSNLSLYYKTNEENEFTLVGTTPVSTIYWVEPIGVGCDLLGVSPFSGSIDLSQSYIKINGKMWWQGNDLGFNQFRVKEGLKTLIPNGRNENRTLKNIEFTVDSDFIYTQASQNAGFYLLLIKEETTKKVHVAVKTRFMQGLSYQMPVTVETIYPYYYYATDEDFYYYTTDSTTADWKPLYASVIGEGASTNGNITSFVPYQPVQLAKEQDIDGMWVGSYYTVFEEVSYTSGQSRTYSLSDYLPNDGNIYEVIFSGKVTTGASTGDTGYMQLETSVIPEATSFVACQASTNRSIIVTGTTIMPVGADRNITISNKSAADTATFQLRLSGYRKAR